MHPCNNHVNDQKTNSLAVQTFDYCAIPRALRDEVGARYLDAHKAVLKTGGDFPFLSRADEVNMHLQVCTKSGVPSILSYGFIFYGWFDNVLSQGFNFYLCRYI